jgi:DNA-binding transcriptional regulator YdaS (Cro superfamily)
MKLSEWMRINHWDDSTLAHKLRVDQSTVNRLRRGVQRPSWKTAVLIERISKGEVTISDFVN